MIVHHLIEAGVVHHVAKLAEDVAAIIIVVVGLVCLLAGLALGHMIGKRRR